MDSDKQVVGFIYEIKNSINGKVYIGQTTKTPEIRFKQHKRAESILGRAIRKHGEDSFILTTIDVATTIDDLNKKEVEWIDKMNCVSPMGYNVQYGGRNIIPTGGNMGIVPVINLDTMISYESITLASESLNIPYSGIRSCCIGESRTCGGFRWAYLEDYENGDAILAEMRPSGPEGVEVVHINTGKVYPSAGEAERDTGVPSTAIIEICAGVKKRYKGSKWMYKDKSKVANTKSRGTRAVINLDTLHIYSSIKEACDDTGLDNSKIVLVCQGKRKTTGGFRWAYCDDHFGEGYIPSVDTVAKPVINIDTGDIFDSVRKACIWSGGSDSSAISRACSGKILSAYGYRWAYLDEYNKDGFKLRSNRLKKKVFNIDTEEEFESAAEAGRRYNISPNSISNACKGKTKKSAGYKWKYI